MELLIVLFPLFGAAVSLFFGRFLGGRLAPRLCAFLVFLSLLLSAHFFVFSALAHRVVTIDLFPWMELFVFRTRWSFHFDSLTAVMLLVVLSISLFVHLYSFEYMGEDPHPVRFFAYLSLFTFFMLVLVTASNFLQLFVGWEGVGVCSYLLISFWFTRKQANKSALKAMVVNRVGDFGLIVAMVLLQRLCGSLDFSTVFCLAPSLSGYEILFLGMHCDALTVVSLALFFGAVGKSAQLGLHTWLPDAMEGPTPVSALIHAATMVTAGVFLLIRCSPILEYAPGALSVVAIFGALTALFGATVGLLQNDLKRVVAYSTCSQLGYMTFCCGLSAYPAALFHLYNHAFFKALLFLGAGAVIHAYADEQDMRRMGGLVRLLPFTYSAMVVGSLSLMGFPFLTGFYSKDFILEVSASTYTLAGVFAYWLGLASAFFTAFYSVRLLYLTFLSPPRGPRSTYSLAGGHEAGPWMVAVLTSLSAASLFVGFLSRDLFVGFGTDFWNHSICVLPHSLAAVQSEFLSPFSKLLPVFLSLTGAFLSLFFHYALFSFLVRFNLTAVGRASYLFLNRRWFFDLLQNTYLSIPALRFGYAVSFKALDRGAVEIIGPTGLSGLIYRFSRGVSAAQSGYLYHYIFLMVFALAFLPLLSYVFPTLAKIGALFLVLALFSPS